MRDVRDFQQQLVSDVRDGEWAAAQQLNDAQSLLVRECFEQRGTLSRRQNVLLHHNSLTHELASKIVALSPALKLVFDFLLHGVADHSSNF